MKSLLLVISFLAVTSFSFNANAQTDTLRIMAYNVLDYGDKCQADNTTLHGYLNTIVQFTQPDILGLEKMAAITTGPTDFHGILPIGFADSVVSFALNVNFPNRYNHCPVTNFANNTSTGGGNSDVLFYNQQKLGYVSMKTLVVNVSDFNLYKLYYKDANLATTHDTTFIYIVLNHTQSGNSSTVRDQQITAEALALKNYLSFLPNVINMGDFNAHGSAEIMYQQLVAPADSNYNFFDPPFGIDHSLTYPGNWDASPAPYTAYLTTSTRLSGSVPNSCGTSGGAKSWYDHMFLSQWIRSNTNYIGYIPNSYKTIGNDGARLSISVNDNVNNSAPAAVINALFQLSNKYPIMASLLVHSNTTGTSHADPVENNGTTGVGNIQKETGNVVVENPVVEEFVLHFDNAIARNAGTISCYNMMGKLMLKTAFNVSNSVVKINTGNLPTGMYYLNITLVNGETSRVMVLKK